MATKNKKENNKPIDLSEYTEEFLERFIEYMAAANSLDKCNPGAISFIMQKNGEKEFSEDEIKTIWSLLKVSMSNKNNDDEFVAGLTKKTVISELNEMFKSKSATIKDKMDILGRLEKYNNWLESSDAEEVIKSNNALIETLNKIFTPAEQEILAFSFVEEEYVSSPMPDDDENESVMSEIEIV